LIYFDFSSGLGWDENGYGYGAAVETTKRREGVHRWTMAIHNMQRKQRQKVIQLSLPEDRRRRRLLPRPPYFTSFHVHLTSTSISDFERVRPLFLILSQIFTTFPNYLENLIRAGFIFGSMVTMVRECLSRLYIGHLPAETMEDDLRVFLLNGGKLSRNSFNITVKKGYAFMQCCDQGKEFLN